MHYKCQNTLRKKSSAGADIDNASKPLYRQVATEEYGYYGIMVMVGFDERDESSEIFTEIDGPIIQ